MSVASSTTTMELSSTPTKTPYSSVPASAAASQAPSRQPMQPAVYGVPAGLQPTDGYRTTPVKLPPATVVRTVAVQADDLAEEDSTGEEPARAALARSAAMQQLMAEAENQWWNLDIAELSMGKMLGRGSFGVVYRARYRDQEVAVKQMRRIRSESEADEFAHEALLMCRMKPHSNGAFVYFIYLFIYFGPRA
jgi:hypothetical protein